MFFKKRRVQSKMKVFRLSFCFALTLHYLLIRLAAAQQNEMKVFRLSFCFALALHYLCILLLQKKI